MSELDTEAECPSKPSDGGSFAEGLIDLDALEAELSAARDHFVEDVDGEGDDGGDGGDESEGGAAAPRPRDDVARLDGDAASPLRFQSLAAPGTLRGLEEPLLGDAVPVPLRRGALRFAGAGAAAQARAFAATGLSNGRRLAGREATRSRGRGSARRDPSAEDSTGARDSSTRASRSGSDGAGAGGFEPRRRRHRRPAPGSTAPGRAEAGAALPEPRVGTGFMPP
ncbi:hypothetical protein SO694_00108062 [Aureococcus anophagefferens]|uniref:Uncharacterized protein n=1 Tax=Aureococcus anophagefferens TaxID=44056 RepID=A0ABR1FMC2_AURAN